MRRMLVAAAAASGAMLMMTAATAPAQETIKIGLITAMSGPFTTNGKQMENGIKTFMKQNGDQVAGKKVEILIRDSTGAAPEVAKRHAQELISRDKVDFLVGFEFTPNALAVAPIATQAKTPTIIMLAATSVITTKSPFVARMSYTLPQAALPMGQWAAKNGIKTVFSLVSDYGPDTTRRHSSRRATRKAAASSSVKCAWRSLRVISLHFFNASRMRSPMRRSFSCRPGNPSSHS